MVELNIANVVTIGIIALVSYAALQAAQKSFGFTIPFLGE